MQKKRIVPTTWRAFSPNEPQPVRRRRFAATVHSVFHRPRPSYAHESTRACGVTAGEPTTCCGGISFIGPAPASRARQWVDRKTISGPRKLSGNRQASAHKRTAALCGTGDRTMFGNIRNPRGAPQRHHVSPVSTKPYKHAARPWAGLVGRVTAYPTTGRGSVANAVPSRGPSPRTRWHPRSRVTGLGP
jgi:hypothetical protein